jgi:hypothetical protein
MYLVAEKIGQALAEHETSAGCYLEEKINLFSSKKNNQ